MGWEQLAPRTGSRMWSGDPRRPEAASCSAQQRTPGVPARFLLGKEPRCPGPSVGTGPRRGTQASRLPPGQVNPRLGLCSLNSSLTPYRGGVGKWGGLG